MLKNKMLLAVLLPWLLMSHALIRAASVCDLRCEDLVNPQGIDTTSPRLSWKMDSCGRDQKQTAFQILVSSSPQQLAANHGDWWDTGKISLDQSIQVSYGGNQLESRTQCFWKVRVWDQTGKVSDWSQPSKWTMGLLSPADWNGAQWIGLDGVEVTNYLANTSWIWFPSGEPDKSAPAGACFFRRVVTIPAGRVIKSALFQYTGDNEAQGWIDEIDLGGRNNFHTVAFNDITTRLNPGQTYVFGLAGYHKDDGTPAGVVGLLEIEFNEGPPMVIPTDEHWRVSDHEVPGWLQTNFDDSVWVGAQKIGPVGMEPWDKCVPPNRECSRRAYCEKSLPSKRKSRAQPSPSPASDYPNFT